MFEKTLTTIGDILLFAIATILFVPAFLIVTWLQDFWSKKLSELFGL